MRAFRPRHIMVALAVVVGGLFYVGSTWANGPQNSPTQTANNNPEQAKLTPTPVGESSSRLNGKPKTNAKATSPALSTDASTAADSEAGSEIYRIGAEDELQIAVWREPELTTAVVVRPDGKITLPLLNDVSVAGMRTEELQKLLTEKLAPFVNEPQVTVIVRTIRSRKVFLVGQIPHPGSYPLGGRKTVMQVLAEAGGLTPFAKASGIYILRNQEGHQSRIGFNYSKAVKGEGAKNDIVLFPGDMIVVP